MYSGLESQLKEAHAEWLHVLPQNLKGGIRVSWKTLIATWHPKSKQPSRFDASWCYVFALNVHLGNGIFDIAALNVPWH